MRLKILFLATLIALSIAILAPIESQASEQPEGVSITPAIEVPIDYAAVLYTMKMMPPRDLIALMFPEPTVYNKFMHIANRETGGTFDCAADNPHSTAAGLFQTLKSVWGPGGTWGHFESLGITWEDVAGPDCLADVILAKAIYQNSGFKPWKVSRPKK